MHGESKAKGGYKTRFQQFFVKKLCYKKERIPYFLSAKFTSDTSKNTESVTVRQ